MWRRPLVALAGSVLCFGVACSTSATESSAVNDAARVAATRRLFADVDPAGPGCSAAVSRHGEVVYAEAFGLRQLEPAEPMTTDTVLDIGSTSKQFTATAIGLLALRGDVELSAAVDTYLPTLAPWADDVTVGNLVHHTSGIPDYVDLLTDLGYSDADATTDADALSALSDVAALTFTPGTSWEYSNSNYFLLGEIVEHVSGSPLPEFLAQEVFAPLDLAMRMEPVADIAGKAVSYTRSEGAAGWEVADSRWEQVGDGGIQTTPSELVRWASQYWESTLPGDSGGLNTLRFRDAAVVPGGDGEEYGFGISRDVGDDGAAVYFHDGSWAGFETTFVVAPEQEIAVAATCSSPEVVPDTDGGWGSDLLAAWTQ